MGAAMKTIIIKNLSLFVLAIVILWACNESSTIIDDDTIYGSGKIVSQVREVEECSGISVKNIGNIFLTQDNSQSVKIEADDNIIDNIITRNENGLLLAGIEDGSYSDITLRIYVSLKSIKSITINGAGNITSQNSFNCDSLYVTINGVGNIVFTGEGNYLNCFINGAGNITSENFIVEKCKVFVNGAGNCTVNVSEDLDAAINGAGAIIYYGNPVNVTTSIVGTGQIIRR
jgi:hypothetical protein